MVKCRPPRPRALESDTSNNITSHDETSQPRVVLSEYTFHGDILEIAASALCKEASTRNKHSHNPVFRNNGACSISWNRFIIADADSEALATADAVNVALATHGDRGDARVAAIQERGDEASDVDVDVRSRHIVQLRLD
jgi:hypothetical protein